ncbi:MAG: hypothetical protein K2Z81_14010, partial [Cyanobacteria bacterium]|nr:hypothetical protein [Cyanobacteriota bacterium]
VSENGNIFYVFPDFASMDAVEEESRSCDYLEEEPWRFSSEQARATWNVAILSSLTCLGSYWLRRIFLFFFPLAELLLIINFVFIYSSLFLCLPLIRFIVVCTKNRQISKRNAQRKLLSARLKSPDAMLSLKLEEAALYRASLPKSKKELVYSTDQDLLEQAFPLVTESQMQRTRMLPSIIPQE